MERLQRFKRRSPVLIDQLAMTVRWPTPHALSRALGASERGHGAADRPLRDDRQHRPRQRRGGRLDRRPAGHRAAILDSKSAIAAADAGREHRAAAAQPLPEQSLGLEPLRRPAACWKRTTAERRLVPGDHRRARVGGATFSYRVSPVAPERSTSSASSRSGPPTASAAAIEVAPANLPRRTARNVFAERAVVIGQDDITRQRAPLTSTTGRRHQRQHRNGNGTQSICGDIRHGVGKSPAKSTRDCDGYKETEGNKDIAAGQQLHAGRHRHQQLRFQLVVCTRRIRPETGECEVDTYHAETEQRRSPGTPTTRTLTVGSNATLTIGGGDYFICSLDSAAPATADHGRRSAGPVLLRHPRDTAASQPAPANRKSAATTDIISTGYKPGEDKFDVPGFYFLGSPTIQTNIKLTGNSGTNELILYAPDSDIELSGNATCDRDDGRRRSIWHVQRARRTIDIGSPRIDAPRQSTYSRASGATHPLRRVHRAATRAPPPDANC